MKSKSADVSLGAIRKITDQKILAELVKNAVHYSDRTAVTEKLTNQNILMEVALRDKEGMVRHAAVARISDQKFLADVAINDTGSSVRLAAIYGITNQSLIADVTKNAKYTDARIYAIEKVRNQKFLAEMVMEEKETEVLLTLIDALGKRRKPSKNSADVLIKQLDSPVKNIQKAAATVLSNFAKKSPELLLDNWKIIFNKVKPHKDIPKEFNLKNHTDLAGSSDCRHDDFGAKLEKEHIDIGIGIDFPEKPPKL